VVYTGFGKCQVTKQKATDREECTYLPLIRSRSLSNMAATTTAAPSISCSGSSTGEALIVAVVFSSGDLGDVGRHAVAAALEYPASLIQQVRVLSSDPASLRESHWKCGCDGQHSFCEADLARLQLIPVDITTASAVASLTQHLQVVNAVISCLGNRQPFHDDCVAKKGTLQILRAITGHLRCHQQQEQQQESKGSPPLPALIMLSSVGIADDWPPMEWSREGQRLQGFFRTICWQQYQDLTGAELAVYQVAQTCPEWSFLIVRSVILEESTKPETAWYVQNTKYKDHPRADLAKMDCARFMVQQAVQPSLRRRAVVLGGAPVVEESTDGVGVYQKDSITTCPTG